jgi:branched-chain amino acid transport system permease protein
MVSLGQMTFYAVGAYAAALVGTESALGYAVVWPLALGISAILALAQSTVTASLREDEFAIATFAMHAVFWMLLMNWVSFTRGPLGIANVPPMRFLGLAFDEPSTFFPLAATLLGTTQLVIWWLRRRPFGMMMRLVRDNEALAANYGRDVKALRRSVWLVAALIAAAAGVLQASYVGYVNPISFSAMESTMLLAVVILGGMGTFWGPVIGAFVVTVVPEVLRFIGFPTTEAANIRQILLGLILILAMFRMHSKRPETLPAAESRT